MISVFTCLHCVPCAVFSFPTSLFRERTGSGWVSCQKTLVSFVPHSFYLSFLFQVFSLIISQFSNLLFSTLNCQCMKIIPCFGFCTAAHICLTNTAVLMQALFCVWRILSMCQSSPLMPLMMQMCAFFFTATEKAAVRTAAAN